MTYLLGSLPASLVTRFGDPAEFTKVKLLDGVWHALCGPTTFRAKAAVYHSWQPGARPGDGWRHLTYCFPAKHGVVP